MYSKPWAWIWTAVIAIGSGVTGYLVAAGAGAGPVWSIVAGVASLAFSGGACVVFMEPGARSQVDRTEDSDSADRL